jgi:hypothetical protein
MKDFWDRLEGSTNAELDDIDRLLLVVEKNAKKNGPSELTGRRTRCHPKKRIALALNSSSGLVVFVSCA